jgi:hypothetical protein
MLSRTLRPAFLTILTLLVPCANAQTAAQTAAPAPLPPSPFEGAPFTLTATAIRAASAALPSEHVSDATILYEESTYRFDATGALNYTHRTIFRIETQKAVEGWSEASVTWDPWYQNPAQIHARVLESPTGQSGDAFVELDQKTITDAPLNTNDDDGTYTSEHVRKAPLPGLAIGAIVEQVESVEDKKPYFNGGLVYRYYFTNNAPTQRERVVVELPSTIPLKDRIANLPDLSIVRSETDGKRRVVYEHGPRAATVYGDIDLTSATAPYPTLEFSTGSSWANVVKRYAELSDPHILTAEVTDLLPADTSNRLATIQQLVQRLHKEVRYTGVEFNEAQLTPQPPSEVLKRHYGDCKDKAALLVSMLRAAHIPANLALLSAGDGMDVNPDLPGMNRFNHAIVFVPASAHDAALWIDATAEFSEVGTLPYGDPGRLALIIDPATTALTRIPPPKPEDSVLIETRTFTLAQLGPSQVVETSSTHGYVDATYRSLYGGPTTKKTQDDLDNYARNAYLAKGLSKFEHGDGADLAHPFQLSLTIDGARRGSTGLGDAAVAIFPAGPLNNLPPWLRTPAAPLPDDATPAQKADRADAEQHRSPTYQIRPFVVEQRFRILVPAGFSLRALPEDRTTQLGPASLTEHYALESPSVFTATLHFTTGKSTLTTEETLAFRDAVVQFQHRDAILVGFEQTGIKLLAAGKIKEALAVDQDAVARDPQSALPHVRLARALLQSGVGDMARKEAATAVQLEPTSAAALTTQGWVLEHDLLGVRFGPGYDRPGAIAAFKAAVPLHSEDFDPRFDLAIQYEFDAHGTRYASNDLHEAIALYRSLIADGVKKNTDVTDYRVALAYDLLFHHDFKDVDELERDLPAGINRSTVTIAAATARNESQTDAAAGIAAANHLNISADERNQALVSTGAYLAQMGLYPQSAAILAAGIQGGKDAPMIARQIELYKNLHRVPLASPAITTPESAAFAMYNLQLSGGADRASLASLISHHAYLSDAAFERNLDKGLANAGELHAVAASSGVAEPVLRDIILGSMTLKATGDDATGYRILSQTPGSEASHMFLVREDKTFRIVADDHDRFELGAFAIWALDHNQPALAKSILDWRRELVHKGGGDDPYSGELLPRYWTVDNPKPGADSPENIRIAALSLLVGSMEAAPYLDFVVAQREKATGARQTELDLLLAELYIGVEQPKPAYKYLNSLLADEPDSITLINLAGAGYAIANDQAAWKALLAPRLARKPADPDLLRAQAQMMASAHDFAAARASEKVVFDSGKANDNDYNSYAWLGLFDNHLGQDVTDAAQQSNMLSKNSSFADLHTMACIYAAQGKVTEAQQVLTQSMTAGNLSQPNGAVWYALGLLYEDYGLPAAALAAYNKVEAHEFDDHHFIDAESTYLLAQTRIHALTKAN